METTNRIGAWEKALEINVKIKYLFNIYINFVVPHRNNTLTANRVIHRISRDECCDIINRLAP